MDALDEKILGVLESDGRASLSKVAESVGLSLSGVQRRIKRLEADGVIEGYRAVVSCAARGELFTVFVLVELDYHGTSDHPKGTESCCENFAEAASALPQIKMVHHLAGTFDYLLRVCVENVRAYDAFQAEYLSRLPHVVKFTSMISLTQIKG